MSVGYLVTGCYEEGDYYQPYESWHVCVCLDRQAAEARVEKCYEWARGAARDAQRDKANVCPHDPQANGSKLYNLDWSIDEIEISY